jgi:hypothetical protein
VCIYELFAVSFLGMLSFSLFLEVIRVLTHLVSRFPAISNNPIGFPPATVFTHLQ